MIFPRLRMQDMKYAVSLESPAGPNGILRFGSGVSYTYSKSPHTPSKKSVAPTN